MEHMKNTTRHMKDDIIESIVTLLQNSEEKFRKGDDVGKGTQEDKDSVPLNEQSINKHALRGFDSNMRNNQGWSPRCIQHLKIDMRNFDGKGPITWIFHMEWFFDIHVDRGENTSQQRGTLLVLQVPIRLTNVWCGKLDEIMDLLPL